MNRTAAAAVIPVLLCGIVFSNRLCPWVPETVAGINLWRILAICFGVYLFYLSITTHQPVGGRRISRAGVECLGCGHQTDLASWMKRGACPSCGAHEYEFAGQPAWRNAQYLPGSVKLPETAPVAAPPTPISRRPHKPQGRLLQPVEVYRTRLGLAEQRRVRSRVADVLVERRKVVRI